MTWDPRRVARAVVLVVWSAFVLWLLVSREVYRYIGLRTYWVVVFGAVTLVVVTIAQVATVRTPQRADRLTWREAIGFAALLCPVLFVLMIPAPSLGARAASARSAGGGVLASDALVPSAPDGDGELTFVDIHYASSSETYAAELGLTEGSPITLTGFVTHGDGTPEGGFTLTRFSISCCAADAVPYSVPIEASQRANYGDDTWLRVSGTLHLAGDRYVLRPRMIEPVPEPQDPYIY
ncbi:MAG TPA: TIGR03943 family protein [Actinomycetota bacterium]|jgi:uncharacterized repeat protein (TIGR03943 family)